MSETTPETPPRPAPRTRDQGPVIVKKYANRRLYNTDSSTYVTLENLAEMVRDQIDFLVVDAKTGDDLTRPTLTQIIVEQEAKGSAGGMNLLPVTFLRQLIGLYGDSMQSFVPNYLEQMMRHFTDNQQQWQQQWQELVSKNTAQVQSQVQAMLPGAMAQQLASPMQALQQAGQAGFQRAFDQNRAMVHGAVQEAQKQAQQLQQTMLKFFMPFASAPNASPRDKSDTLSAMKQHVASLEEELKGMNDDN